MDETSGPGDEDGSAYSRQHIALGAAITDEVNATLDTDLSGELVFCSRSGPPSQPWLEPDVNDRLQELAAEGAQVVVVSPIGFVSDHMEVVYDLDTEAAATAEKLGLQLVRVPTVGIDPEFVSGLVDLVEERAAVARGEQPVQPSWPGRDPLRSTCAPGLLPQPAGGQAGAVRSGLTMDPLTVPADDVLAELEQLAVEIALEAGRLIVDERPADLGVSRTKSTATDVVTVMDQRAQDLLRSRLRVAAPRRRLPRRGGGWHRPRVRDHLGRRPHRRDGQLPLRHPLVCRVRRRRRR